MSARDPVTIVVPTLGRPSLARCVESLLAARRPGDEVVLVVQGDEATADAIAGRHALSGVDVVVDPGRGVASGTNLGLRLATHDTVLVTHDDCTVDRDWVRRAADLARRDPEAIFTGRVMPVGDPRRVPSCKTSPVARDYTGTVDVGALYPNNMVVPRQTVLAMGAFDGRIPAAEDCDFCFRWLVAGRRLRYEPELVVHHHDWRSTDELERLYRRYAYSSGILYGKHLAAGDLRIVPFLVRDLRTGARGSLARVRGRPGWADRRQAILPVMPRGIVHGLWRLRG